MTRELLEMSGDGMCFYEVPEHSDTYRTKAAEWAIGGHIGGDPDQIPNTVAWLAARAERRMMGEHTTDPDDYVCGCEDKGWWCENGDGEQRPFYSFEASDLYDRAESMGSAELEAKP